MQWWCSKVIPCVLCVLVVWQGLFQVCGDGVSRVFQVFACTGDVTKVYTTPGIYNTLVR